MSGWPRGKAGRIVDYDDVSKPATRASAPPAWFASRLLKVGDDADLRCLAKPPAALWTMASGLTGTPGSPPGRQAFGAMRPRQSSHGSVARAIALRGRAR